MDRLDLTQLTHQGWLIVQGDCLEVMRQMPGESIDVIVTSPPYNQLGRRIRPSGIHSDCGWIAKVMQNGYADEMPEPEYQDWQVAVLEECYRLVRPAGSMFYNHKLRYRNCTPILPLDWIRRTSWHLRQELVWDKGGSMVWNARMFAPADERIYWLTKGRGFHWNKEAARYLSVWRVPSGRNLNEHPCPYPLEIARRCIHSAAPLGGVVLDPFAGSGTTLVAAIEHGLLAIGIEKEPRFCEITHQRMAEVLGVTVR